MIDRAFVIATAKERDGVYLLPPSTSSQPTEEEEVCRGLVTAGEALWLPYKWGVEARGIMLTDDADPVRILVQALASLRDTPPMDPVAASQLARDALARYEIARGRRGAE